MERLSEGYVDVKNPFNLNQVRRVSLMPEDVDCFVFWSKYPAPLIKHLESIDHGQYQYYFLYSLTAYGNVIEPGVPRLEELLATFRELSSIIGKEKVIWRYDPILLSDKHNIPWQIDHFKSIASKLEGLTEKCVISFIDIYKKCVKKLSGTGVREPTEGEILELADGISRIASGHGIRLASCAEEADLTDLGIERNKCIDNELVSEISGKNISLKKDKYQRPACMCVESIDIGTYNTCGYGCLYCYANR
jgi:hypothetical protein